MAIRLPSGSLKQRDKRNKSKEARSFFEHRALSGARHSFADPSHPQHLAHLRGARFLLALRVRLFGVSALKDQPAAYKGDSKGNQRHAQSSHVTTSKTTF